MISRLLPNLLAAIGLTASSLSALAGDFPLASCKGWNATLTERSGIDTSNAILKGVTTQADFAEYCLRDPGGETTAYGGKLSVDQCAMKYFNESGNEHVSTLANCDAKTLTFFLPNAEPIEMKFPLPENGDRSCAGGYPPLEAQFVLLCPKAAEKMGLPTE